MYEVKKWKLHSILHGSLFHMDGSSLGMSHSFRRENANRTRSMNSTLVMFHISTGVGGEEKRMFGCKGRLIESLGGRITTTWYCCMYGNRTKLPTAVWEVHN